MFKIVAVLTTILTPNQFGMMLSTDNFTTEALCLKAVPEWRIDLENKLKTHGALVAGMTCVQIGVNKGA